MAVSQREFERQQQASLGWLERRRQAWAPWIFQMKRRKYRHDQQWRMMLLERGEAGAMERAELREKNAYDRLTLTIEERQEARREKAEAERLREEDFRERMAPIFGPLTGGAIPTTPEEGRLLLSAFGERAEVAEAEEEAADVEPLRAAMLKEMPDYEDVISAARSRETLDKIRQFAGQVKEWQLEEQRETRIAGAPERKGREAAMGRVTKAYAPAMYRPKAIIEHPRTGKETTFPKLSVPERWEYLWKQDEAMRTAMPEAYAPGAAAAAEFKPATPEMVKAIFDRFVRRTGRQPSKAELESVLNAGGYTAIIGA